MTLVDGTMMQSHNLSRFCRMLLAGLACMGIGAVPAVAEPAARAVVYVNNQTGTDQFDGLAPVPAGDGKSGPLLTIMAAVKKAPVSAVIQIANTGHDYRESVEIEGYRKGRANLPLVLEGNGATVNGLVAVPTAGWNPVRDDLYAFANRLDPADKTTRVGQKIDAENYGVMPNSNWLGHFKHQGWFTEPQAPAIFFLNDKPGPNVLKLEEIPAGGFFYDTQAKPRTLYFRLPAGGKLADCRVELPLNRGVYVSDDYVVVRNLASIYSQDDGFAGFWGQGVVLQNVNGSFNCDQGISFHGTSSTLIDGGLFERNGGCGIADVMSCITVYRNVTVRDNLISGALFQGVAHSMINCRLTGNDQMQVDVNRGATINLTNCLILGESPEKGTGINMENGRLDHCTIANCRTGVRMLRSGSFDNSIITQCHGSLVEVVEAALPAFQLDKSLLDLGCAVFGKAKVDQAGWAEFVKTFKAGTTTLIGSPGLDAAFQLPSDSPYLKAGSYNSALGCRLPEVKAWAPLPAE